MKRTLFILALGIASNLSAGTVAPAKGPVPTVAPEKGPGTVVFGEHQRRDQANYTSLGFMHALNNDLSLSGLYFRGFVGGGYYDYFTNGLQVGEVTTRLLDVDAGIGYRHVTQYLTLGAFASVHMRDRDMQFNDPANDLSTGTRWGARFGAEATGNINGFYYSALGQVSTVEWAIWSRARVGYTIADRVTIGPEFIYLNDAMFDERRYGGFITIQVLNNLSITASGGSADYGSAVGGAGNTPYGALGFAVTF